MRCRRSRSGRQTDLPRHCLGAAGGAVGASRFHAAGLPQRLGTPLGMPAGPRNGVILGRPRPRVTWDSSANTPASPDLHRSIAPSPPRPPGPEIDRPISETQRHDETDPSEFVERLAVLRAMNLAQYQAMSADQLDRIRLRNDGREVTLRYLLGVHAGHDLAHLDQLERYLGTLVGYSAMM